MFKSKNCFVLSFEIAAIKLLGLVFLCQFLVNSNSYAGPALIVNIDSPNFRKILSATPNFYLDSKSRSPDGIEISESGAREFSRLLTFTGLFNTMDSAAFADIMTKASESWYTDSVVKPTDLAIWKAISAESLTLGMLSFDAGQWTLSIKTIDVARGEVVVGKKYSRFDKSQIIPIIRRYGDAVLKAYTGKSGIFNSKLTFVGKTSVNAAKQIYISDFDGYTSFQDGNPDLFVYDTQSRKSKKLSGIKGINSGGNFAPNGKFLAFTGSINGDADIYSISPNGGTRKLFISGTGLDVDPTFSPDGKMLAFVSGRFGNPHIFVASLKWNSETDARVINDKRLTYVGWYNATPSWTPESDRLAFAGYDKEIDRFDLFLMNPDGTKLERLTLRTGDNERPWFSPNGQNLVFMSNRTNGQNIKGVHQLYIMNRDGSNQRKLETGLFEAQTPSWSINFGE
ncbi:MAG: hypothetical protein NT027_06125 [Proteobacteria bacterium]|nr:hypothetical protein [Pseudomonadota bacterium]